MLTFTSYLTQVARANGLGNLSLDWLFYPGMLQDSPFMWWADFGTRHAAHEGIDICLYKNCGNICALEPCARVPAMAKGCVLNISKDLMGKSVVVGLDLPADRQPLKTCNSRDTLNAVLVYSHLEPEKGLCIGDCIEQGVTFAATFDARTIRSRLLSHLHISCILIEDPLDKVCLDWQLFADRNRVTYVNPVFL